MIGSARRWAYANARLRAHVGRLVTRETLATLARAASAQEAWRLLEEHPPGGVEAGDLAGPRGTPGRVLYRAFERHLLAVSRLLSGGGRDYFLLAFEHLVVDDLKQLIRRIVAGLAGAPGSAGNYLTLGGADLAPEVVGVATLDALASALEGTVFAAPYRLALETYHEHGEILAFEVALDLDYHRRLREAALALPAPDDVQVDRLFRRRCDVKNVAWILRYRFGYELSEVEIYNYALPFGYELDDDTVLALARASELAQSLEILSKLPIGRFVTAELDELGIRHPSTADVEAALSRYGEGILRSSLSGYPFGMLPFVGYLGLKELEMERLRRILVGHQLELGGDTIVNCLHLTREDRLA